jgi:hypothetical protein
MKKLVMLGLGFLLNGCMTFKKIENHYIIQADGVVIIREGGQNISGSDAKDSLNGNDVSPELGMPVIP